jgi:hypothetical protein
VPQLECPRIKVVQQALTSVSAHGVIGNPFSMPHRRHFVPAFFPAPQLFRGQFLVSQAIGLQAWFGFVEAEVDVVGRLSWPFD